ncbi:MAG TPA: hypothetical protein VFB63_26305, partial [Bryobacteraceae bacterium]|nr:hypothetical protein [Bryobacteraceae bacterium]
VAQSCQQRFPIWTAAGGEFFIAHAYIGLPTYTMQNPLPQIPGKVQGKVPHRIRSLTRTLPDLLFGETFQAIGNPPVTLLQLTRGVSAERLL